MLIDNPTDEVLLQHHCLEVVDKVPGDQETTAFKRKARLHQAVWRQCRGFEIGTQPVEPVAGKPCRPLGSRLRFGYAAETGVNFLGEAVRCAVQYRVARPEPGEMLDKARLFCDLLSSMPMCFNLFGWLHNDPSLISRATSHWWPQIPGSVSSLRFEWSPGRGDSTYLGNHSAFDVAFELALGNGRSGIIGVETKYHEHAKAESKPKPDKIERYASVATHSAAFKPGSIEAILGTDMRQIWLDHLLALSMLLHTSKKWQWVRFVLIHPKRNPSFANAAERYKALLADESTFEVRTIESMLDDRALPSEAVEAFRERYLW